ncbi:MAG: hypothetical protein JW730_06160 [Anaerolineales bacterium]|nr:hypothetical protein [Anaerolineales bacterium]
MATKCVILANDSRLLREMLQRVINKADNVKVVQEISNHEELPSAIERLSPEWVILSLPFRNSMRDWMGAYMAEHPSVRFILLSPDNNSVKMKSQVSCEADLTNLSLKDFIQILQKDFQHT